MDVLSTVETSNLNPCSQLDNPKEQLTKCGCYQDSLGRDIPPGLPDFSWYKIPKRGEIDQMTTNYTK
jgi:hypothetical protein